jgi:hypothetical protein
VRAYRSFSKTMDRCAAPAGPAGRLGFAAQLLVGGKDYLELGELGS